MPSYAIMRWSKITSAKQAAAATGHNYRKYDVPNADKVPLYANKEFINLDARDYWELANERIKEAGVKRVRSDSVKGMEVILTGSPEAFTRDENGRATDYSDSKWAKDNLVFLQDKFGAKNVLSFTLHQDEKTPHIHAVIAPITPDGRLSADQLFNPTTMRQYQTDYAEAMKPHGMERGVNHSQAVHQPMQQFYGQQAQTANQVAEQLRPVEVQPIKIDAPTFKQKLNLDKYVADIEKQVNAELSRQVGEAIQQTQPAINLAVENASAKEEVRALQQQLHTSEKLKESKTTELTQVKEELLTKTDQVTQFEQTQRRHAVLAAEGRIPADLVEQGKLLRRQAYQEVGEVLVNAAQKGAVHELNLPGYVTYPGQLLFSAAGRQSSGRPDYGFEEEYWQRVKAQGCEKGRIGERDYLTHLATGARFPLDKVQAGGQPVLELVAARKAAHEALFAKIEQQNQQATQEQAASRERDRLKVEGFAAGWLKQETLYDAKALSFWAGHDGITVTSPQPGQLRLRLEATGQEFTDAELKPNGKPFSEQFRQVSEMNMAKFTREYEAGRASISQITR